MESPSSSEDSKEIAEELSDQVGTAVIYEDDRIRVWLLELGPGEASEWHRHSCDYLYVTTLAGQTQTEYLDGSIEPQDDLVGDAVLRRADPGHRLVNMGKSKYQNVVIEFLGMK